MVLTSLGVGEYAYIPVIHSEGLPPVTRRPAYFRIAHLEAQAARIRAETNCG